MREDPRQSALGRASAWRWRSCWASRPSSWCSPSRSTSARRAGPTRPSGPTTPRPCRPPGRAAFSAERPAEHRILEATEPSETAARGDARVDTLRPGLRPRGGRAADVPLLQPRRGHLPGAAAVPQRRAAAAGRHGGDPAAHDGARSAAGRGAALRAPRRDAAARPRERRDPRRRRPSPSSTPRPTAWRSARRTSRTT